MEQFLRELEDALKGEVSEYEYRDSLSYYREYFREQMSLGKSEREIVDQLGSPRLIARSIIDARGVEEESGQSEYYDNTKDTGSEQDEYYHSRGKNSLTKKLGGILTIILVLFLLGIVLRAILPLALIIIPVFLIIRLFQGE